MLATRAGIYMPAWMAIKARHLQYYDNDHACAVPEDLLSCFKVLKKCMKIYIYIKQLTPNTVERTVERANGFYPC